MATSQRLREYDKACWGCQRLSDLKKLEIKSFNVFAPDLLSEANLITEAHRIRIESQSKEDYANRA